MTITIYKGTGIQAAKSMIAWLKFALFKAKKQQTHFNGRRVAVTT